MDGAPPLLPEQARTLVRAGFYARCDHERVIAQHAAIGQVNLIGIGIDARDVAVAQRD